MFLLHFLIILVYCSGVSPCPEGTIQSPHDVNWCYKFVNNSVTFSEADHSCVSLGGRLVEIDDAFTNNFLSQAAYSNFTQDSFFWIGGELKKVQTYSIWTWVQSGKYVDWFDWSDPDAGTNSDGKCISVNNDDSTWNPQNCSVKLPYVCQIPSTNVVTKCESGWTYFEKTNQWYRVFVQRNVMMSVAEQNCVSVGGHLVSIHSDDENDLVAQMTSTLYLGSWPQVAVWIGLQTNAQGNYSWTDGSEVNYFNWGASEPNNSPPTCVLYYPDGVVGAESYVRQWTDDLCTDQLSRYVCKKLFHTCQDNNP